MTAIEDGGQALGILEKSAKQSSSALTLAPLMVKEPFRRPSQSVVIFLSLKELSWLFIEDFQFYIQSCCRKILFFVTVGSK